MPATSVRDVVVKGDDLVAGTHGRGFFVLDDITPLRQLAAAALAAPAHLFAPQPALRWRANKNTDTPLPPDEPAAPNPPEGAIVHYHLASAAKHVALEVRDSAGRLVRRYASDDAPEAAGGRPEHPRLLDPAAAEAVGRGRPAPVRLGPAGGDAAGRVVRLPDGRDPRRHAARAARAVGAAGPATRSG